MSKCTNYTLTQHAKNGFLSYGRYLHIDGYDNIISFIIWHTLDVNPIPAHLIQTYRDRCTIRRLDYAHSYLRVTVPISFDEETKQRFERMYLILGIKPMSAALDLLGQALNESDAKPVYRQDIDNPFYLDKRGGIWKIRCRLSFLDYHKTHADQVKETNQGCPSRSNLSWLLNT